MGDPSFCLDDRIYYEVASNKKEYQGSFYTVQSLPTKLLFNRNISTLGKHIYETDIINLSV